MKAEKNGIIVETKEEKGGQWQTVVTKDGALLAKTLYFRQIDALTGHARRVQTWIVELAS